METFIIYACGPTGHRTVYGGSLQENSPQRDNRSRLNINWISKTSWDIPQWYSVTILLKVTAVQLDCLAAPPCFQLLKYVLFSFHWHFSLILHWSIIWWLSMARSPRDQRKVIKSSSFHEFGIFGVDRLVLNYVWKKCLHSLSIVFLLTTFLVSLDKKVILVQIWRNVHLS